MKGIFTQPKAATAVAKAAKGPGWKI